MNHKTEVTAQRHADLLNQKTATPGAPLRPVLIHRTERYSAIDLLYRGWTREAMEHLLGNPDARDDANHQRHDPDFYDADRVHDAEIRPAFDRLAAASIASGELTTYEEDYSAPLRAISMDVHLEIPSADHKTLIDYARRDLQRMADEKTARMTGMSTKKHLSRIRQQNGALYINCEPEEALRHAALRCCARSHPANVFFHHYGRRHLGHEASLILDTRLARAAIAAVPWLQKHLNDIAARSLMDNLPGPGHPLPWPPHSRHHWDDGTPLPEKLHNLTNLRWARYRPLRRQPPPIPAWGRVTVTAEDGSLPHPVTWYPNQPPPAAPGAAPAATQARLL